MVGGDRPVDGLHHSTTSRHLPTGSVLATAGASGQFHANTNAHRVKACRRRTTATLGTLHVKVCLLLAIEHDLT